MFGGDCFNGLQGEFSQLMYDRFALSNRTFFCPSLGWTFEILIRRWDFGNFLTGRWGSFGSYLVDKLVIEGCSQWIGLCDYLEI